MPQGADFGLWRLENEYFRGDELLPKGADGKGFGEDEELFQFQE